MVVGAAGNETESLTRESTRQRTGVLHDLVRIVTEHWRERLAERNGLRGDCVFERPALSSREDSLVDLLGVLGFAENATSTRTTQRFVRRERDDVGIRHGVRMCPTRDESGKVCDVEHE